MKYRRERKREREKTTGIRGWHIRVSRWICKEYVNNGEWLGIYRARYIALFIYPFFAKETAINEFLVTECSAARMRRSLSKIERVTCNGGQAKNCVKIFFKIWSIVKRITNKLIVLDWSLVLNLSRIRYRKLNVRSFFSANKINLTFVEVIHFVPRRGDRLFDKVIFNRSV